MVKITKQEAQEIFKLRTSDVKTNIKGKYETFECDACKTEQETQKHIIKCNILNEKNEKEPIEYEEIFTGNVKMKIAIVKRFLENTKLRENFRNKKG